MRVASNVESVRARSERICPIPRLPKNGWALLITGLFGNEPPKLQGIVVVFSNQGNEEREIGGFPYKHNLT